VINSDTLSLGTYHSKIEGGGMDVTKGHSKRIKKGLRECIKNFMSGKKAVFDYDSFEKLDFSQGVPNELKEGFYDSYAALIRNTPLPDTMTEGKTNKVNKQIVRYFLRNQDGERAKFYAYKSKNDLYLNVSSFGNVASHYLKSHTKGRYQSFVERVTDPAATAAFGLIGAAASTKKYLFILDLATGEVVICNKEFLLPIVKDYPDLVTEHRKTKQKIPDRIVLMQQINDRLKENEN